MVIQWLLRCEQLSRLLRGALIMSHAEVDLGHTLSCLGEIVNRQRNLCAFKDHHDVIQGRKLVQSQLQGRSLGQQELCTFTRDFVNLCES